VGRRKRVSTWHGPPGAMVEPPWGLGLSVKGM
jgi:hypothetical protein